MNLYSMKPSQTKEAIIRCMLASLVPFVQSSPGMGKSSLVRQIGEENDLEVIDVRLSVLEPTDLSGLPYFKDGKAKFHPYDMFPLDTTPIPPGKNGWILFLDEFNSASRAVQAAAYKLILDHAIGQYKLHPKCYVVCAGNKLTDGAITTRLSTAMISRVIHLNMEINFDDWMENVAIPQEYDERIIAYLSMYPEKLMQFDPEKEDQTFACPRSWEFVNRLIKGTVVKNTDICLLAGTINEDLASEFVQFTKVFKKLLTITDIIKADGDCPVPEDTATRWAIVSHLMLKVEEKDLKPVMKYINKLDSSFRLLFYRAIIKKYPQQLKNSEFRAELGNLVEYLLGD